MVCNAPGKSDPEQLSLDNTSKDAQSGIIGVSVQGHELD